MSIEHSDRKPILTHVPHSQCRILAARAYDVRLSRVFVQALQGYAIARPEVVEIQTRANERMVYEYMEYFIMNLT